MTKYCKTNDAQVVKSSMKNEIGKLHKKLFLGTALTNVLKIGFKLKYLISLLSWLPISFFWILFGLLFQFWFLRNSSQFTDFYLFFLRIKLEFRTDSSLDKNTKRGQGFCLPDKFIWFSWLLLKQETSTHNRNVNSLSEIIIFKRKNVMSKWKLNSSFEDQIFLKHIWRILSDNRWSYRQLQNTEIIHTV